MIKSNNLYLLVLTVLMLFIIWPIFAPGYFSHHDDLQVMRIFEMRKCLEDFQIPCRWVPDMGYGNGFPLFNYYGPFPYYIGGLASFILGFLNSAKLLFLISLVVGPFAMYFLGREVFGKTAGFVAAVLYAFAPYRALDIYVRGAIGESFAIALIPLVLYWSLKLIKKKELKDFLWLALSFAAFLTSHTVMTLYFTPILIVWVLYWGYILKDLKSLKAVMVSLLIGFGIASFYIVPAYLEKSLAQTDNLIRGDLNFRAHYVTIHQLFSDRSWGYGSSIPGIQDTISFQLGWPHWFVVVALVVVIVFYLLVRIFKLNIKFVKVDFHLSLILILGLILLASLFMTHARSAVIWEQIEILKYSQFPWRFLPVSVVVISLLGGAFVALFNGKFKKIVAVFIVAVTVLLNWSFFQPEKFYPEVNDNSKLSGFEWELQSKAAILDYLPVQAVEPREPAQKQPLVVSGEAITNGLKVKSNKWSFSVDVKTPAEIVVPVFDFPNWQVFVNEKSYPHTSDKVVGRIMLNLDPGEYEVKGVFKNTPVRLLSNIVSIISLILLVLIVRNAQIKKLAF